MIPGFYLEDDNGSPIFDPDKIFSEFTEATEETYWHQIERKALQVDIEFRKNNTSIKTQRVLNNPLNSSFRYFIEAQSMKPNSNKINAANQISRKTFNSIKFPPKIDALIAKGQKPDQSYSPDFRLSFQSKNSSILNEKQKPNTVAMIRGLGRVVEYAKIRPSFDDFSVFGVLEMGTAVSPSNKNVWAEEFIATAEPPQHNKLLDRGEKLKEKYKSKQLNVSDGYTKAIQELYANIKTDGWIDQLIETSVKSGKSLPKNFMKLFKLHGKSQGKMKTITLNDETNKSFNNGIWTLSGRIEASEFTDDNFKVEITVVALSDKNEKLDKIDISPINTSNPALIIVHQNDPKKIIYEVLPQPIPGTQQCLKDYEFELAADRKSLSQDKVSIRMYMKPLKS